MKTKWGVGIVGDETDVNSLEKLMSKPFDPFIESREIRGEKCIILFSSSLEPLTEPQSVYKEAKLCLNMIINLHLIEGQLFDVRLGAVWDFTKPDGPKATHVLEGMSITARPRFGIGTLCVYDKNGKFIPQLLTESFAQRALRVSQHNSLLDMAIRYNAPDAGWVDLYKIYECFYSGNLIKGYCSNTDLKRFTGTANNFDNRHREGKNKQPPNNPMTLPEARKFISEWIRVVVDRAKSE